MKMDASNNIFDKKKDEWQTKINLLELALEKKKASLHEEKARRRHQLTEEESRRRKLEEEIHELNKWIFELDNKREAAETAGNSHSIPLPEQIEIQKLRHGGVITTDTCNQAQKVPRLLCQLVDGALDFDCMNHLRNVWFGGMEKTITRELNLHLHTSLDEIDPRLRVTTSMSATIRAVDKEFSLSANYPKDHGKLFLEWLREYYSGVLLLHVERAAGSRQDLCTEGSMAVYLNYPPYYVEFLDMMLCKHRRGNSNDKASILQQNLFVALTSEEMIALSRLLTIFHISVCVPFRWLSGKTHELKDYGTDFGWGAMSMSRVIDTLYEKMNELHKSPSLIVNEGFMMSIFNEYLLELPPFEEYWKVTFEKKQMSVVACSCKDGTKVVHMALLRKELLSNDTNKYQNEGHGCLIGRISSKNNM